MVRGDFTTLLAKDLRRHYKIMIYIIKYNKYDNERWPRIRSETNYRTAITSFPFYNFGSSGDVSVMQCTEAAI